VDRRRFFPEDFAWKGSSIENRLQVRNLATSTTDDDLTRLFSEAGEVLGSWIIRDAHSGASRGYGFVIMSALSEADRAVSRFNNRLFQGQTLKVTLSHGRTVRGWDSP
jgi:RNA recognition motif-containing protein